MNRQFSKLTAIILVVLLVSPENASALVRVFLTTAQGTSWTVPSDWSDVNTIEAIGGGGTGDSGTNSGNGGGGGGAYSAITNVAGFGSGQTVTVQVGGVAEDTIFDSALT